MDLRRRKSDARPALGRTSADRCARGGAGNARGGAGMILLGGIPSEPPLALVAKALEMREAPFVLFNQRAFANAAIGFELSGGRAKGSLQVNGADYPLDDIAGVYTRLMDYRRLPELAGVPETADAYRYCAALNDTLSR